MEFASAIIGFAELLLMGAVALTMTRANPDSIVCRRSSRQGSASVCPRPPPLTRRPAPVTGFVGFDAWNVFLWKRARTQKPPVTNGAAFLKKHRASRPALRRTFTGRWKSARPNASPRPIILHRRVRLERERKWFSSVIYEQKCKNLTIRDC